MQVHVIMSKEEKQIEVPFRSNAELVASIEHHFEDFYARASMKILASLETFTRNGSGWSLGLVKCLEVRRTTYRMTK